MDKDNNEAKAKGEGWVESLPKFSSVPLFKIFKYIVKWLRHINYSDWKNQA